MPFRSDVTQTAAMFLRAAILTAVLSVPATSSFAVSGKSAVDDLRRGASLMSALDADTIPSPGLRIGVTIYDSQHNYSQGHQVAKNPGSDVVHFVWTMLDRFSQEFDRFVNYNSYTISTETLNQDFNGTAVSLGDFSRGGYPRLDVGGGNLAHATLHQREVVNGPNLAWHLGFPIEGDDDVISTSMVMPAWPLASDVQWPDIAVGQHASYTDPSADVYHIIAWGEENFGSHPYSHGRLWYHRYDAGAESPIWEGPVVIDSSSSLAYVIDADDNSHNVALAFTSDWITDGYNQQNNLVYRESPNAGSSWFDGSGLGEVNKNYITTFNDISGPQAWFFVSIAYDHSGDLHVVYTEQRYSNISEHGAIKHWSKSRGTSRTVALGHYDSDANWGGHLNLTQPTLGIGDGSTLCEAGLETNEDYLYVVYVKLTGETPEEQVDASRNRFANGELYLNASADGGDTWSFPQNLTNTKSPGCTSEKPDSVCASESYATIGRVVDDIHIFYIRDFEAGDFTESGWNLSDVMYLRLPGGTVDAPYLCPILQPIFSAQLSGDDDCEYHTSPGSANFETLSIGNYGTAPMSGDISVLPGAQWLSVTGAGPYTHAQGLDDLEFTVTMDATFLAEGVHSGTIRITHDDTSQTSPVDIPVDLFVADPFFCPEDIVLKTAVASPGVLSLQVRSDGRFGAPDSEGGLWRFADSSHAIYDATLLVAHGSQNPDTVVYHRFYSNSDPGQNGYRSLAPMAIDTNQYLTGTGRARATAEMTTADSLLGIRAEWFFPQHPDSAEFVIVRYTVSNPSASPISDVAVGIYADLNLSPNSYLREIQSDPTANHGNYVALQNLIYQYGYDSIGHNPFDSESSMRYSAGFTYIAGTNILGDRFEGVAVPIRGGVGDNRDNTLSGRPTSGHLYRQLVGSPGVTIWEPWVHWDSSKDAYTWLTLDQGLTLAPGEERDYVVGIVSDTLSHDAYPLAKSAATSLESTVEKAWAWAAGHVLCNCPCANDPECDGVTNVIDVVHAVNVAFRSAAPMIDETCPLSRTDVDCSGFTNVIDVVKIVNVAFRNANLATEFCDPCVP